MAKDTKGDDMLSAGETTVETQDEKINKTGMDAPTLKKPEPKEQKAAPAAPAKVRPLELDLKGAVKFLAGKLAPVMYDEFRRTFPRLFED